MPSKTIRRLAILICLLSATVFASNGGEEADITSLMANLVFQIGIIIFAARIGGAIFTKLKLPSVLGELVMGVIIGPYMFGSIVFPGFDHGLFPVVNAGFPISPELYGISTIASIILLFSAGLETDFAMFIRYSFVGIVLGIGGVVASFVAGAMTAVWLLGVDLMSPTALFLGVMSTATSVGITARILSERRKMDSPEGVSIMAGAVIDDILGIILLAVVVGITAVSKAGSHGSIDWMHIAQTALKAVSVWLIFTAMGIFFSRRISTFLKRFRSVTLFSVISLGMAFILAGIFEKSGLAMIIGAYIMGLSLSRTDLNFVIHDRLHSLQTFFVPIFFTVVGMLVNPRALISKEVITFGLIYTGGAIAAKVVGCGFPALALNFNRIGALRIGLGMVPRGEVALIIAGIGLSRGILNESIFGAAIMMTLLTTMTAPPLLNIALRINKGGTKKSIKTDETLITEYSFPSKDISDLIEKNIIESFQNEGFFVSVANFESRIYNIRKEEISVSLLVDKGILRFKSKEEDISLIRNMMFETLLSLNHTLEKLQEIEKPDELRKCIQSKGRIRGRNLIKKIDTDSIVLGLQGKDREEVVKALIDTLVKNNRISNGEKAFQAVIEREKIMGTGLKEGIAIPHARIDSVKNGAIALGVMKKGVDFGSIDGVPSTIIALVLSDSKNPSAHIQMIAGIASIFTDEANRKFVQNAKSQDEVYNYLANIA